MLHERARTSKITSGRTGTTILEFSGTVTVVKAPGVIIDVT